MGQGNKRWKIVSISLSLVSSMSEYHYRRQNVDIYERCCQLTFIKLTRDCPFTTRVDLLVQDLVNREMRAGNLGLDERKTGDYNLCNIDLPGGMFLKCWSREEVASHYFYTFDTPILQLRLMDALDDIFASLRTTQGSFCLWWLSPVFNQRRNYQYYIPIAGHISVIIRQFQKKPWQKKVIREHRQKWK